MRSLRNDPLYPAARQLLRRLAPKDIPLTAALSGVIQAVADRHGLLKRNWRLLQIAQRRGWRAAAERLGDELLLNTSNLRHRVDELLQQQSTRHGSAQQANGGPRQRDGS